MKILLATAPWRIFVVDKTKDRSAFNDGDTNTSDDILISTAPESLERLLCTNEKININTFSSLANDSVLQVANDLYELFNVIPSIIAIIFENQDFTKPSTAQE